MGIEPAVAQTAVRFSLDGTATAHQMRVVASSLRAALVTVRKLGT
jgi:cysteine desulfurase